MTLVQSVMAGARVVLMERFSADGALELIEKSASPTSRPHQRRSSRCSISGTDEARSRLAANRDHRRRLGSLETIKAFQAAFLTPS